MVVAVVVVEEEGASTIETVVKAASAIETTVVKPEAASAIETVVRPEVAKPEATESTLLEVVEAAIAKLEITTLVKPASAAEITAASAVAETTAPVCRLR